MRQMNMRRLLMGLLGFCAILAASAQNVAEWKQLEKPLNFYLANDLGRNGYYDQKPIAELMGRMAENVDIECVVAAGDVHHFEGVRSTSDPLWQTNYEWVYSHPELMLPWYAIMGNHEYRGCTQAVLDYTRVSGRWNAPSLYYTKVLENDGVTVRLVMLDTTPMMDKYRNDAEGYPDACRQNREAQLAWADSVLSVAREDWVLVVGHHPIYAYTSKSDKERADMQKYLNPILLKHKNVDMYLCGHIHNFQHIRMPGSGIDYVVNSSGSLAREVEALKETVFCSPASGFSLITADKKELDLHMIDKDGRVMHTVRRVK